ncbi:MAG TPA: ribokinase [Burkholderiaceae bacterium]|nr:ribokinase [Burkholderiaceae bacterium]
MILVAGSANLDFVVRAPHIPAPGETVLGREFKTYPGGKGANQAVACARAGGAPTHMLLALGDDLYARPLEESLNAANVKLHIVRDAAQATGTAFICVSDDAENAITVAPGANAALQAQHLPTLDGVSHLLMQLETPLETVTAYAKAARAKGVRVVLNAAPAQSLPADLLKHIDILIANEGELAAIASDSAQNKGSIAQSLAKIDVPCVVVTLGHHGCCARVDGQVLFQPAFPVMPVDTTGAGDTFCGVLVAALQQKQSWPQALAAASAAGALACTKPGAQSSIPEHAEVAALVARSGKPEAGSLAALQAFCGFPA